jgi:polar amino acid transport system substrate-binding protein
MEAVCRELTPTGTLRAAVSLSNEVIVQRVEAGGEPRGLAVELAHELARQLSVPSSMLAYEGTGQAFEAGLAGAWDLAFLAIDPMRCVRLDFTAPYVVLESTYLVRDHTPYRTVLDVDREGVRIAVNEGGFYDLRLTRTLKHARLVRVPTYREAAESFLRDRADALAGLRQPLAGFARAHSGMHVIEGRFTAVEQAIALPKGRSAGLRYLNAFLEQMKSSGRITRALRCTMEAGAATPTTSQ